MFLRTLDLNFELSAHVIDILLGEDFVVSLVPITHVGLILAKSFFALFSGAILVGLSNFNREIERLECINIVLALCFVVLKELSDVFLSHISPLPFISLLVLPEILTESVKKL
jgi:hypothetical protein